MRLPRRDKQTMYYSLFNGSKPLYQTDDYGNIVYVDVDGRSVPIKVGETSESYTKPIEFRCSISSELNEMHCASYGVDASSIYCTLITEKDYVPLEIGALIWRTSRIEWEDVDRTIPKASSADYTVVGFMKESMTSDHYLLKCNSSE